MINDAIATEFKKRISTYEWLRDDVDSVHVVNGSITYTYAGIMQCAVLFDGKHFGDVADINTDMLVAKSNSMFNSARWFGTLDKLLDTLNKEANPEAVMA